WIWASIASPSRPALYRSLAFMAPPRRTGRRPNPTACPGDSRSASTRMDKAGGASIAAPGRARGVVASTGEPAPAPGPYSGSLRDLREVPTGVPGGGHGAGLLVLLVIIDLDLGEGEADRLGRRVVAARRARPLDRLDHHVLEGILEERLLAAVDAGRLPQ